MDGTKIIKKLLLEKDINTVELAKRLGCGTANLYNKYKRNNFSLNELEEIAAAVGCNLEITFSDKQGNQSFSINQSVSLCPHWLEWFGRFRLFVSCVLC